ncbi:MAG: zinc ABC transporter substrate-binding protein, partial [Methanosarcinales archaeon]|nr:zinc ABC transporter substrate-binding protein [Methanosarcinales archaeon]
MKAIRSLTLPLLILAALLIAPAGAESSPGAIKIVCTTSVLMDQAAFIGGDRVSAISIADPTLCPHLQTDIIPSRIQLNMDFIRDADLFMAYNDSNDQKYNMPAINDFIEANNY